MKKINGASYPSYRFEVYTYIYVGARGNLLASLFPNGIGEKNLDFMKGINSYNYG